MILFNACNVLHVDISLDQAASAFPLRHTRIVPYRYVRITAINC